MDSNLCIIAFVELVKSNNFYDKRSSVKYVLFQDM